MEFTQQYYRLKNCFHLGKETIDVEGGRVSIMKFPFFSSLEKYFTSQKPGPQNSFLNADLFINENRQFMYPVFMKSSLKKFNKAIILLHGLNERSWDKYLSWASYLAEHTDSAVILFPISFHMNRSPDSWSSPRSVVSLIKLRKQRFNSLDKLTVANITLSERLTQAPSRFFTSGYQSAKDILRLVEEIQKGKHPLFSTGTQVNFFAYSIGAFLSQILFAANPKNLFSASKLFIFCGGPAFSEMYGTSKFIMDSKAFEVLYSYYTGDYENKLKQSSRLARIVDFSYLGKAFKAMLSTENIKDSAKQMFLHLENQVQAIALNNDRVMPASGILKTFKAAGWNCKQIVKVMDLPYDYTHENPFPVGNQKIITSVDEAFDNIFSKAAAFLR
ncbi:MAG TPA: DUF6051 family protein [Bacteroidales bacterium]|nr:DUF6051 family protein [Bacteroidales bacterium]